MKPWREVAVPHQDVLEGTFQQSEFAADITAVNTGKASREYQDADAFFDRTFITEIAEVISALSGDELDALAQIGIRLPLHEVARTRVVRREDDRVRVFWSFSAVQVPRSPERAALIELVQAFRSRVNEVGARARIQGGPIALDDGQFLIIDDHRFFHGRDPLPPGSRRHLFRCYLRLHDPRLRAAKLAFQPDHANQADRADRAE